MSHPYGYSIWCVVHFNSGHKTVIARSFTARDILKLKDIRLRPTATLSPVSSVLIKLVAMKFRKANSKTKVFNN